MLTGLDSEDPVQNAANHTASVYRKHMQRFAKYGIQIYRVQKADVHNMHEVALNLPGRDEKIAAFLQFIRELGEAGIRYNTYVGAPANCCALPLIAGILMRWTANSREST